MPPTVDPAERRALIDSVVVAIAAESGFDAVTIRAVAQRIGGSTSAVTHYVANRDELLSSAAAREIDTRITDAEAALGARTGSAGLRALLEWAMTGPDPTSHQFWLASILAAQRQPVLAAELNRFNTWWAMRVDELLAQSSVADTGLAADVLNVFVDGLVVNGFYDGSPWVVQRRQRLLDAVWEMLDL